MFGFQNDPAASKIFGRIIIHNWKSLFRDDQGILPENREGLLWSHSFNKEIESRVNQFLKPILDTERRKLGPSPEADKELDKKMKSTLAFLNKLMQEDEFEDEKDVKAPPEVMEFSYGRMKIVPGKTKTVKLFINPNCAVEYSTGRGRERPGFARAMGVASARAVSEIPGGQPSEGFRTR